ncbi:MAG: YfhO family protein [Candidatus Brocadiia bacterium]|jgi:hypothetical protein
MAEISKAQADARFDAKDAGILLALLLVTVIALWPILCAAPTQAPGLPGQDGRTQWYPWRALAADSIRHGSLPLWNPYVLCGVPFLGNFQSALFYPPNIIFAVAPIGVAARVSILFHVWLSMIFVYLLARMVGAGRAGRAVGALAFGLCAAQVLRVPAGHWGNSCAIPWLALIFLCTEWIMRRPSRWALLVGAFAVAMQILSGMPQYVFMTAVSAGFYALIRPLGEGRPEGTRMVGEPWKGRWAQWAMVAGMWLLGSALAAVQLLPGIEAAANGARGLPMLKNWLMVFSLGPECLLTMVVPGLFGGTADGSFYWGRWLFWEMNAYIGIAALVLAVYALICERPRRAVACFALTACLALLLALGEHTHATDLLALTPLGGMFRGPAKFLLPFSLALSVLAAFGTERLLSAAPPKLLRFVLAAAVAAAMALAILLTAPGAVASWQQAVLHSGECLYRYAPNAEATSASALPAVHDGLQALLLLGALVGGYMIFRRKPPAAALVILFIVAADSVLFSRGFIGPATTFRAEKSAWPEGAGAALRREGGDRRTWAMDIPEMDDAMLERVPVVEGIEPNPPARFHQFFQIGQGRPVDIAPSLYRLLSPGGPVPLRTALGRVLGPAGMLAASSQARVLWNDNQWEILELPSSATRAQVVYRSRVAHSPEEALEAALTGDPRSEVVLEEESAPPASPATGARTLAGILEDAPDDVAVTAALEKPGWLVLRDNYFPGWKAEVDGAPARILRADYAFRAVALSAGSHRVVFRYRPGSFSWGIGLSLAALATAVGIAFTGLRKR